MPCRVAAASVEWVTSDAALAEVAAGWGSVIGLDTEFQRTNTFYPIPGLYQVVSGDRVYLLDPLTIEDWQPFVELVEDPDVVLIMHACSEDLELMRHHIGAVPAGVFDTQLAHAFLSTDFSKSYANLVAGMLDVQLPKHETRSDWLQRPLTEQQIRYAWEDVAHLPELYRVLSEGLEAHGRSTWFDETMRIRERYEPGDPDEYYRGIKKAWRLQGAELSVLRALAAWRERQAMSEDVPRNRIVWDEHLVTFARAETLTDSSVWQLLPKPVARKYGAELVAVHEDGRGGAPVPPLPPPLTQAQGEVSKAMRAFARERAESLSFAQELLARKRDVEECIRHYLSTGQLSATYAGWREGLVGDRFRTLLERVG